VVFFGIKEISGHIGRDQHSATMLRQFLDGWKFVGSTPLVRGLVFGILGAFAAGGVVVGTAQFFAAELKGGDSTFAILFAVIFIGLGAGIGLGPRLIGALSRRRWFGLSIILAAGSVALLSLAVHLSVAVVFTLLVGAGAGMAFLSGTTLLGGEVDDEVRGRVFAVVQTGTRVVLMLAISLSGVAVGLGGSRAVGGTGLSVSSTRLLLGVAGLLGVAAGVWALKQMDDKPGVPVLADLWSSIRGRPLGVPEPAAGGVFLVFEGGEGAGKSTQIQHLAELLRAQGRDVVVTREPGATEMGARIRRMVLDSQTSPRAEALLYAADRAHHVSTVVRPALARGAIVISDRYVDSSLAYQGAGRELAVDEIAWLSAWATGGLKPDLVILMDIDPRVGLTRAGRRGAIDLVEQESMEFHDRVRAEFLELATADPARYIVINADADERAIAEEVAERVSALLPPVESAPEPPDSGDAERVHTHVVAA
jgi:dTMP kinase